jgi:metal-responsive CopG/Arc/MetJ family transcriptional regulator
MRQLNLNVTEEFERDLRRFMRQKGITKQSEAIRQAVREAAAKTSAASHADYRSWLGLGLKAPLNPKPRFRSEDDLWL